ncbi:hypothetical protein C8F01DRAFT_1090197 [Mycena amicta]|nr:hypothetical protein C8F01DRAFT_1090197 [Mycena amicta]
MSPASSLHPLRCRLKLSSNLSPTAMASSSARIRAGDRVVVVNDASPFARRLGPDRDTAWRDPLPIRSRQRRPTESFISAPSGAHRQHEPASISDRPQDPGRAFSGWKLEPLQNPHQRHPLRDITSTQRPQPPDGTLLPPPIHQSLTSYSGVPQHAKSSRKVSSSSMHYHFRDDSDEIATLPGGIRSQVVPDSEEPEMAFGGWGFKPRHGTIDLFPVTEGSHALAASSDPAPSTGIRDGVAMLVFLRIGWVTYQSVEGGKEQSTSGRDMERCGYADKSRCDCRLLLVGGSIRFELDNGCVLAPSTSTRDTHVLARIRPAYATLTSESQAFSPCNPAYALPFKTTLTYGQPAGYVDALAQKMLSNCWRSWRPPVPARFHFYANDIKLTLVIVPSGFVHTSSRNSERSSSSAGSPAPSERPDFSPVQTVYSPSFRCLGRVSNALQDKFNFPSFSFNYIANLKQISVFLFLLTPRTTHCLVAVSSGRKCCSTAQLRAEPRHEQVLGDLEDGKSAIAQYELCNTLNLSGY